MNVLKNRTFQLTTGLLALGAIGLLTPRVAHAVVATLVQIANTTANPVPNQDVDNSARNFYQSGNHTSGCSVDCTLDFPAVPTGKRLIVQQASATISIVGAGAVAPTSVQLRESAGGLVFQNLSVVAALSNFTNSTIFTAHDAVLMSYDVGQVPTITVGVPSTQSYAVFATISGHMINYP